MTYNAEACYQPTKDALYERGWPDKFRLEAWRKYRTWDLWELWTEESHENEDRAKEAENLTQMDINAGRASQMNELRQIPQSRLDDNKS